jgi:hypothetical protein
MSLPLAEFISFWSNWILIGALIVGVVATYGIVVSGNVKESAANTEIADAKRDTAAALERIAVLNKETARLSADAEASRAAIADANARAIEAQAQLAQFKAPRTMTEVQARHFVEKASKYSGTQADIWIIGDTPEPTGIGQIIFRLLEISGWKTTSWNWTGGGAVTGIAVVVRDASGSDIDQAANFLVDSLNAVGIASAQPNWSADWDKFPGMLNGPPFSADKAAPIRIVIGTKPQQ